MSPNRRAQPGDDLLSGLITVREGSDRLSEDELASMVVLLIAAGHETAVDIKYVSQRLRLAPGALGREKIVLVGPVPGTPTNLFLFAYENDEWLGLELLMTEARRLMFGRNYSVLHLTAGQTYHFRFASAHLGLLGPSHLDTIVRVHILRT